MNRHHKWLLRRVAWTAWKGFYWLVLTLLGTAACVTALVWFTTQVARWVRWFNAEQLSFALLVVVAIACFSMVWVVAWNESRDSVDY
jgi:hypothetical protein